LWERCSDVRKLKRNCQICSRGSSKRTTKSQPRRRFTPVLVSFSLLFYSLGRLLRELRPCAPYGSG
jgi:hypothetical protein